MALAASLTACATSEQTGSGRGAVATLPPCGPHQTIEAYCASHGPCPSYEEDVVSARKELVAAKGGLFRYIIGTCGDLRFVTTQTMGAGTNYFDATGKLVATDSVADTPMCSGPQEAEARLFSGVGVVTQCKQQVVEQASTIDDPPSGDQ
ncbi:MAG: hypothetical protein ABI461_06005 [Polyangiaceae bacterium]